MAFQLSRKSGIPLYVQLKDQIRQQVESNSWPPGFKLPAERELAILLGVSRNTVSQAYRELEHEGQLQSVQGRGTFVAEQAQENLSQGRKQRLTQIIEQALESAQEQGFSLDEVVRATAELAQLRQAMLDRIRIVFVECNREQVDYFAKQLELESHVAVIPMVLGDVKRDVEHFRQVVQSAQLIVTTFFHAEEIQFLLPEGQSALAIALDPLLETIVRIARIPKGKRLGLVCLSTNFAEKVTKSIRDAGIDHLPVESTISLEETAVRKVIERSDLILVSPGRKREVLELCEGQKEVIEFVYRPDLGSINMLKSALMECRHKSSQEEGESS